MIMIAQGVHTDRDDFRNDCPICHRLSHYGYQEKNKATWLKLIWTVELSTLLQSLTKSSKGGEDRDLSLPQHAIRNLPRLRESGGASGVWLMDIIFGGAQTM